MAKSAMQPAKPEDGPTASGGVAAVDRALSILAAFTAEDPSLSLAELAARTGLYKSTLLRLAQSLIARRLLMKLEDGRYRLGSELLRLGALSQQHFAIGDGLLPVMRELAAATGESVAFYVPEGDARICLYRIQSNHAVRYHVREGDRLPLQAGSAGRVIAAFLHDDARDAGIRRQMHHMSFGERDPDIAGVAAPVFGRDRHLIGALTVAGPRSRVTDSVIHAARRPLLQAAAKATWALGGDPAALRAAAMQLEKALP